MWSWPTPSHPRECQGDADLVNQSILRKERARVLVTERVSKLDQGYQRGMSLEGPRGGDASVGL